MYTHRRRSNKVHIYCVCVTFFHHALNAVYLIIAFGHLRMQCVWNEYTYLDESALPWPPAMKHDGTPLLHAPLIVSSFRFCMIFKTFSLLFVVSIFSLSLTKFHSGFLLPGKTKLQVKRCGRCMHCFV